jgi:predicted O-linked N-acetylglucosamine transferase (SPINDLY family)
MRILRGVDGSVLWLLADHRATMDNLGKEAAARGVDPKRLVFARRMPPAEHLARHRVADLFLDTLPCNAHTTACEALWAGLPLLTRIGETFAGRVAASVLGAIGLRELITETAADYERRAVALAGDPARLAALRGRLAQNRLTKPLFDTRLFTRHMEAAFVAMHRRHQEGGRPDHISVRA